MEFGMEFGMGLIQKQFVAIIKSAAKSPNTPDGVAIPALFHFNTLLGNWRFLKPKKFFSMSPGMGIGGFFR